MCIGCIISDLTKCALEVSYIVQPNYTTENTKFLYYIYINITKNNSEI